MYTRADEMKTRAIINIAQKIQEFELRDLFAIQILKSLLDRHSMTTYENLVKESYKIADIMISVRGEK